MKILYGILFAFCLKANAQIITTFAGGGVGDGFSATLATLSYPYGIAIDSNGNIYFSELAGNRIRKIDTLGQISTLAGNGYGAMGGIGAFSGDGGPATAAELYNPAGIAVDAGGNVYIADCWNHRIRKVDTSGIISTFAGNCVGPWGTGGYSGDGGPATAAQLNKPLGVALDNNGNVFIADMGNQRIRKVNAAGIISTIAGIDSAGFSGDGGPATLAKLYGPANLKIDKYGNIFIADMDNQRIRKVDTLGIINTIAGNGFDSSGGLGGGTGDGGPATAAELNLPSDIVIDEIGNVFFADSWNNRIRKVDISGIISTISGVETPGYSGDGFSATVAQLGNPTGLAFDKKGNTFIADSWNNRIRKVDISGIISTFAGSYWGDGGAATQAALNSPSAIAADRLGNVYIAEDAYLVRKVNNEGVISTFAGGGNTSSGGDGGPATNAGLFRPCGLAVDESRNVYIVEPFNYRIRKVDSFGIISTFAGNGNPGYSGDGGPATAAEIKPAGVAVDRIGNVYIAEGYNGIIRKVNTSGIISTIAGITVICGYIGQGIIDTIYGGDSGDGGLAITAAFYNPISIALDSSGNIYISDEGNDRVRKIDTNGFVNTFAGVVLGGSCTSLYGSGFSGDGGLATAAQLSVPYGLTVDNSGNVYIADEDNRRIRKVNELSIISTFAGDGILGHSGDGGAATAAEISDPVGLTIDNSGNIYIADYYENRIRKVSGLQSNVKTVVSPSSSLNIAPNPSSGNFTVNVKSNTVDIVQFTITNIEGQKVQEFKDLTNKKIEMKTFLPDGVYYISAITQNDKYFDKIVIIK